MAMPMENIPRRLEDGCRLVLTAGGSVMIRKAAAARRGALGNRQTLSEYLRNRELGKKARKKWAEQRRRLKRWKKSRGS
jgi:hypothetical protein